MDGEKHMITKSCAVFSPPELNMLLFISGESILPSGILQPVRSRLIRFRLSYRRFFHPKKEVPNDKRDYFTGT
jgi:hypothetical protein